MNDKGKPDLERVLRDETLGPMLEQALRSPHWKRAAPEPNGDGWEVRVLKFRPGRRLSLAIAAGRTDYVMKIWYNRRGERIARRLERLGRKLKKKGVTSVCAPTPLFYDADAHALVYRRIEGEPLTKKIRRGSCRIWIPDFARAMRDFHSLRLPELKLRTPADEIKTAAEFAGEITNRREAGPLLRVLEVLAQNVPPPPAQPATLHRDLYDQQVLMLEGGAVCLIDLDDIARGDPMLDLGNFLAHFHVMGHWQRRPEKLEIVRRRLSSRYFRSADAARENAASLAWHEAIATARLAALQYRRGDPDLGRRLIGQARRIARNPQITLLERIST